MVPTPDASQLAFPYGALLQELSASPQVIMRQTRKLLTLSLGLDAGPDSTNASIILFTFRLAARITNAARFVLGRARGQGAHVQLRDMPVTDSAAQCLESEMQEMLAVFRNVASEAAQLPALHNFLMPSTRPRDVAERQQRGQLVVLHAGNPRQK